MSTSTLGVQLHSINTLSAIPSQRGRPFSNYVAGFMFEVFLYGINIALVSTALYTLVRRSRGCAKYQLLVPAMIMLMISTTCVSLSMYTLLGLLIKGRRIPSSLVRSKHMLYLVNNVISDVLLISRCYSVWSKSIRVIAFPSLFLVAASIYGIVTMIGAGATLGSQKYVYLWLTLALNLSVTALTAGRVLCMARKAQKILGPGLARKYYSVMAIIVESGAIYSSYVLLDQILITCGIHSFVLDAGLAQLVVISPALIIVQIGLGRHIRDLDSTIQLTHENSIALSTVNSETEPDHRVVFRH